VDCGITKTPQIGLYWNSLEIFPVGYSHVDGWFVGWGEFDEEDEDTLDVRYAGILGMVLPPYKGQAYTPACVHFVPHLGYVGLVWNGATWRRWISYWGGPPWTSPAATARNCASAPSPAGASRRRRKGDPAHTLKRKVMMSPSWTT